ncbi:putative ATP-citrate synthase subunit 1 [Venturia nashicola]|nr:putative ATP-citrate synthase subunit 1 [Venturia nashicola]
MKVGPNSKKFKIHRDLLRNSSPYFETVVEVKLEKGQKLVINWQDVPQRTFDKFHLWLKSGILLMPADSDAYIDPIDPTEDAMVCAVCGEPLDVGLVRDWPNDILSFYILAHQYDFPLFRRAIMIECQHLSEILSACVPIEVVTQAYENLPDDSPFIQFLIQEYKLKWKPKNLLEDCPCQKRKLAQLEKGEVPYSFTIQVMIQSHHRNEDPTYKTGKVDWCEFHEHNSWAEAEKCRAERLKNGRYSEKEFLDESELLPDPSEITGFRVFESETAEST